MIINRSFVILCFCFLGMAGFGQEPLLRTLKHHPMQYYLSLPEGWKAGSRWPVVISLEEANKQYKSNAVMFTKANAGMPFIIVVPFITTNGGQGHRDPSIYPYSKAVWDSIDKAGICEFDMKGIENMIREVKENYGGTDKVFLTGFEAGAHLLWAIVFKHPEWLYAAVPVAGNYRNRCMESGDFSNDKSRESLPIRNFTGAADSAFGIDGRIYYQYQEAKSLVIKHGYSNLAEITISGKGHEPMPAELLAFFRKEWEAQK